MSRLPSSVQRLPSDCPEFSQLVSDLYAAAEALLTHPDGVPSPPTPEEPARRHEYRSYRVPHHALDDERELLEECGADRIGNALHEIHAEFYLMLTLMQAYAESNDDGNSIYPILAEHLTRPLERLAKACSVLVDFELQPNKVAGA